MKKISLILLLALFFGLASCNQEEAAETLAVSSEPGVVTVFKSPT